MRLAFLCCLFFVILLLPCSFCDDVKGCFRYSLENECSIVLTGNVSIEENEQEDFFNQNVSLVVSNVRMVQESCRRPFLFYYCQLMFGGFSCESSSLQEQHCLEQESCFQVSSLCSDDFQLNCSLSSSLSPSPSPSPSPTNGCESEVERQIDEVKETPIKVETCLNGSKERIECCPDPFTFDDNDECVVECYQYLFGQSLEYWVRIISFVFTWFSLFTFGVSLIPLSLMTDLRYPNNVIFLSEGSLILACLCLDWSTFVGGPESFVCDGKKNYWKSVDSFQSSTRSAIQFSLYVLFLQLGFTHWLLLTFNLFCHSMRPFSAFFDRFIEQPVNPRIIYLMEGFCICLPTSTFLGTLIYWLNNESDSFSFNSKLLPLPVYSLPFQGSDLVLIGLLEVPGIVYAFISSILCFVATGLYLKRGRAILYFQWRTILFLSFGMTVFFFMVFYVEIMRKLSNQNIVHFMDCVGSHPQDSPPPCERQYNNGYSFVVEFLVLVSVPGSGCVILFWTNPYVFLWWKELIFSRRILTSSNEDYQEIGINRDSSSNL